MISASITCDDSAMVPDAPPEITAATAMWRRSPRSRSELWGHLSTRLPRVFTPPKAHVGDLQYHERESDNRRDWAVAELRQTLSSMSFVFRVCAGLVIALAMLGAACGSSTKTKPAATDTKGSTSIPATDDAFQQAADSAADSALLVATDFPSGWTGTQHAPNTVTGFTGDCDPLNPQDPITGSLLSKPSNDFADTKGGQATSQVDVFRTAARAADSMRQFQDVVSRCHDQFVSVFTGLYQQSAPAANPRARAQNVSVTFGDRSVAAQGDAVHAYRIAFSYAVNGAPTSGTTDIVFIERGRLIGQVYFTVLNSDAALGTDLASVIADRLANADRGLPP